MSNKSSSEVESIACYIRCKPLNSNEQKLLANSIEISNNSKSFIINKKDNYILKSGFWDNRIEYNTIPLSAKEESNMKIF